MYNMKSQHKYYIITFNKWYNVFVIRRNNFFWFKIWFLKFMVHNITSMVPFIYGLLMWLYPKAISLILSSKSKPWLIVKFVPAYIWIWTSSIFKNTFSLCWAFDNYNFENFKILPIHFLNIFSKYIYLCWFSICCLFKKI